MYFYKIVHNLTPPYIYLSNILTERNSDIHYHNTRNASRYRRVLCRTNKYNKSVLPSTVDSWNSQPLDIKHNPSVGVLNKYVFSQVSYVPLYYYCDSRMGQLHHAILRMECSTQSIIFSEKMSWTILSALVCRPMKSTNTLFHCSNYARIRTA